MCGRMIFCHLAFRYVIPQTKASTRFVPDFLYIIEEHALFFLFHSSPLFLLVYVVYEYDATNRKNVKGRCSLNPACPFDSVKTKFSTLLKLKDFFSENEQVTTTQAGLTRTPRTNTTYSSLGLGHRYRPVQQCDVALYFTLPLFITELAALNCNMVESVAR
jgi:hypothetical protein